MDVVIDQATIEQAVAILRRAAPGARIIVFGSHARGEARPGSDLDLLVVEPHVTARREEAVRLRDALRPLRIPVDVLVTSQATYERWAATPGTVYYEAAREGRVFDAQC
jgi:predicted nucleotidyltransferase